MLTVLRNRYVFCYGMFASHVMETDVKVGKGSYHRLYFNMWYVLNRSTMLLEA